MHRCSVFKNACINVPVDPISRMPQTAYERNEKNLTEQCSIESSCGSVSGDVEAEKLKDFYRSIPDYNDINHLSEAEFYSTLKSLRDKKKLMLGLAVEHIDDCNLYDDTSRFDKEEIVSTIKRRPFHRRKSLTVIEKPKIPKVNVVEASSNIPLRKIDDVGLENGSTPDGVIDPVKNSSLSVKGSSKMDRPKRNHSACSISWHDDKIGAQNEIDDKFDKFFEGNKFQNDINDAGLYKTQSMPSSPLRTRRTGSLRRRKSITIPKPFKMTERDEEARIVNELRGLQKSLSDDMLHQKRERKRFRAKPVPIESRIPLYDKILEDQAMRRAITKMNSEAELRAQMQPFSFTRREEGSLGACERAATVLPKSKKKKRFRARPVPKNLFSNYFYDKMKEDNFFRSMNRRVRAEEMLRTSSFPGSMAARDRSRLSTPAAHSDLPIDPSPAVPSSSSSDRHRSLSPTKELRKSKAKEDFITTSPQPFRFNTAERATKKMNDITRKIYQGSKSSDSRNGISEKPEDMFNKTQAYSALDLKGIAAGRSNLAALLRAEAVRQRFELESARQLAEQRRRADNRHRNRLLRAKPAWHLVKNNHEEDIAMRLQTRRDEERMRREEFLHEMELMYGRVQQQPMLFERYYAPRSGATTVDSIQLSPRKSPSKKRSSRKNKSYQLESPSLSPEFRGDLMKYLDKKSALTDLYDDRTCKENLLDSLERN